jgi:formylmethanofuran dehydrogenase subunit C
MIIERMAVRRRIEVPDMAARRRFGRYKKEAERGIRDKAVDDPILGKLEHAFHRLVSSCRKQFDDPWRAMPMAESLIAGIEYDAKDITRFSLMLAEIEKGYVARSDEEVFAHLGGLMLSALINHSHEESHLLKLEHLQSGLSWIGYGNRKDIVVEGDVGILLGSEMKDGRITVFGGVGEFAGSCLEDGTIVINGDAEEEAGGGMRGGYLYVKGNGGRRAGQDMIGGLMVIEGSAESVGGSSPNSSMWGGEIRINGGEPPEILHIRNGRIIHKGKLIVDK